MEYQPQNPEFRIILKTFTHEYHKCGVSSWPALFTRIKKQSFHIKGVHNFKILTFYAQ